MSGVRVERVVGDGGWLMLMSGRGWFWWSNLFSMGERRDGDGDGDGEIGVVGVVKDWFADPAAAPLSVFSE